MDCNSVDDLERLEEQIFAYKPLLKSADQKQNVSKRLREQLVESKAVVRIQKMDAECETLMLSLKQRLLLLQDILKPKEKDKPLSLQSLKSKELKKTSHVNEEIKLNLSSDSSDDDETLGSIISRQKAARVSHQSKVQNSEMQMTDISQPKDANIPLALRRNPRERKLSYKSFSSSASTSLSKNRHTKLQNKQEQTVTTSGVTFHSEETLVEHGQVDTTPTIHIKIPSLHRGNVHYIILDSLDFARKAFNYRANEVKQLQQQQHSSITHNQKLSKSRKKQVKPSSSDSLLQQFTQQEQELELSQLIQDVMAEACSDETLQATSALENINNNLMDNYQPEANENFIAYSQSSQDITLSQNSNIIIDNLLCSSSGTSNLPNKQRKNSRRSTERRDPNEPPKKRGRKSKKKIDAEAGCQLLQPQPPTKSNLAKYVEYFANDCELMPGSTTPAASSTRSQPLVSSTTHNFEVVDQQPQADEQQTSSQQPITYYIDGDWANGGPCQLVATNTMSVESRQQLNQDDLNAPFQDFVNYIDNNSDSGSNNVIARVLESNNSLPVSIPLLNLQNRIVHHQVQATRPPPQPTIVQQNSLLPVINIQIPTLPNNIVCPSAPPPAHTQKEVLDLSVKPKSSVNTEVLNLNQITNNLEYSILNNEEEDCLPLDLSAKGASIAQENIAEKSHVTIDKQDEEFIRRLIEQSDFEYRNDDLKKANDIVDLSYDTANSKSFKAALDMPLLEFDAADLAEFVENTSACGNSHSENLTDKVNYNDCTNNDNDSNYVSMTTADSAMESNLHFADQTTSEMFDKLLNICPANTFLEDINQEFISNDDLNESVFDQCSVKNSTMCENVNVAKEKNMKVDCDTSLLSEKQQNDNALLQTSDDSPHGTSLIVQIDNSNKTADFNISASSETSKEDNNKIFENGVIENSKNCKNLTQISATFMDKEKIFKKENEAKDDKIVKEDLKSNQEQNDKTNKDRSDRLENNNPTLAAKMIEKSHNNNNITTKILNVQGSNDKTEQQIEQNKKNKDDNDKCLTSCENYVNNNKNETSPDKVFKELDNNKKSTEISNDKDNKKSLSTDIKTVTYKQKDVTNNKISEIKTGKMSQKKINSDSMKSRFKTNENVVFSVVKITLSDDDNLYSTDSDTASGNSIDGCDLKPMESDRDIQNEKSKSINVNKDEKSTKSLYPNSTESNEIQERLESPKEDNQCKITPFQYSDGQSGETNQNKNIKNETSNSDKNSIEKRFNELKSNTSSDTIIQNELESTGQIENPLDGNEKDSNETNTIINNIKICDSFSEDILNLSNSQSIDNFDIEIEDLSTKGLGKTADKSDIHNRPNNSCYKLKTKDTPENIEIECVANNPNPTNDNEYSNDAHNTEEDDYCNEVINLSILAKPDEENYEKNLDLYNNDEDFVEINAEQFFKNDSADKEEFVDSTNCLQVVNSDNQAKSTSIDVVSSEEKFTLLELESKLEGSLDFEEDFDDALSLATSCFDSPNDDRFEDSVVNVDNSQSQPIRDPSVETTSEQTVNANTPLTKDLKSFKIPKLNSRNIDLIATTSKVSTNETTNLESPDCIATTSKSIPKVTLPNNMENIIRTVTNDLIQTKNQCVQPSNFNMHELNVIKDLPQEISPFARVIHKVFGITCLPFLVDKCYAITHCQLLHQFNNADTVYQNLSTLDKSDINIAYQAAYNHAKLFQVYFSVFCSYYSNKNERLKLINMVNDCERYPEYGEFIGLIYEALVKCGLNRVNACRLILKRIRESTTAAAIIEVLVAIIIKSDWTMFTDFIEKYTQEFYKFNFRIGVLEQMAPSVLNSKGSHLKQVFGKCVQTLHCDDTGLLLNSPKLIQCVALLTTTTNT